MPPFLLNKALNIYQMVTCFADVKLAVDVKTVYSILEEMDVTLMNEGKRSCK